MGVRSTAEADGREFYTRHSPLTDPGDLSHLLDGLPRDVATLVTVVRGVLVHRDEPPWRFGFELSEERYRQSGTRRLRDILAVLGDLRERPVVERFPSTCRDFCVLLCALLRHAGVPARPRAGFGNYFPRCGAPALYDDHWVVEYWDDERGWLLADAELARPEDREAYQVEFDAVDVPRDRFLVAGRAWLAGRSGEIDPGIFTISGIELSGLPAIQGTVVRDLGLLNLVEALPWDNWGVMTRPFTGLGYAELALLDQVAEVGAKGGPVDEATALYWTHVELQADDLVAKGLN
ncbi:transglutaminase-like domain-containing protein [Actinosynnema sp. NPDC091369]